MASNARDLSIPASRGEISSSSESEGARELLCTTVKSIFCGRYKRILAVPRGARHIRVETAVCSKWLRERRGGRGQRSEWSTRARLHPERYLDRRWWSACSDHDRRGWSAIMSLFEQWVVCSATLSLNRPVLLYRKGHVADLSSTSSLLRLWLCASAIFFLRDIIPLIFSGNFFLASAWVVLILLCWPTDETWSRGILRTFLACASAGFCWITAFETFWDFSGDLLSPRPVPGFLYFNCVARGSMASLMASMSG